MKRIHLILVFGLMSMLLTYGIATQIRTVNNNGTTVNLTAEQSELKSEILKISEKYDNLNEEIGILEKELEGYIDYKKKVRYRLIPFIW